MFQSKVPGNREGAKEEVGGYTGAEGNPTGLCFRTVGFCVTFSTSLPIAFGRPMIPGPLLLTSSWPGHGTVPLCPTCAHSLPRLSPQRA